MLCCCQHLWRCNDCCHCGLPYASAVMITASACPVTQACWTTGHTGITLSGSALSLSGTPSSASVTSLRRCVCGVPPSLPPSLPPCNTRHTHTVCISRDTVSAEARGAAVPQRRGSPGRQLPRLLPRLPYGLPLATALRQPHRCVRACGRAGAAIDCTVSCCGSCVRVVSGAASALSLSEWAEGALLGSG